MKGLFLIAAFWALTAAVSYGQTRQLDSGLANQSPEAKALIKKWIEAGDRLFGAADASVINRTAGTLSHKDPRDFQVGDWGWTNHELKVLNKVSGTECLVAAVVPVRDGRGIMVGGNSEPMLLRGLDTSKVTDGVEFILQHPVIIHGTYSYTAVSGTEKTVLVLDHNIEKLKEILKKQDAAVEAKRQVTVERAKAEKERKEAIEAAKWRTWTDATGEHKTDAKFGGLLSGKVTLIRRDGSKVQVPLEKLSDEDREWITTRRK
jgi:hypothetical protein